MESKRRTSIAPPAYDDLFLHIARGPEGGYAVHAWSSAGEATEPFIPPRVEGQEPPAATGERLFAALFTGRVLRLYEHMEENDLRLKLMIDPSDPALAPLQALPWELIRRPGTPDFLALNRQRSIVRHFWIPRPVTACPRPERLRILVVAASPRGRDPIDRETEIRNLKKALATAGDIEIVEPIPSTREEMRQALLAKECHMLHFIGHGGFSEGTGEGILAFEKEDGTEDPVSGTDLVNKLAGFPALRLAVLNACKSVHVASSLVTKGLPAVVAMREPIYDDSAAAFSRAFYARLAAGDPVDAAVVEGRQAAGEEWAIPALFMRTPQGELFPAKDIDPPKPAPRPLAAWLAAAALALLLIAGAAWWRVEDRKRELTAKAGRLNNEGIHLLDQGRQHADEAMKKFREALVYSPSSAEIHSNLARACELGGQDKVAWEHYREAARLQPTAEHLYNLGHFLNDEGDHRGAYKTLRKAVSAEKRNMKAYAELARAALGLGLPDKAGEALQKAFEIDPARASDWAPLRRLSGEMLLMRNEIPAALQELREALKAYPWGDPGRIDTAALMVEAYDRSGGVEETCRMVEEFRSMPGADFLPPALMVDQIAERRGCPSQVKEIS